MFHKQAAKTRNITDMEALQSPTYVRDGLLGWTWKKITEVLQLFRMSSDHRSDDIGPWSRPNPMWLAFRCKEELWLSRLAWQGTGCVEAWGTWPFKMFQEGGGTPSGFRTPAPPSTPLQYLWKEQDPVLSHLTRGILLWEPWELNGDGYAYSHCY